jgi:hypothetical protein
VQGGVYVAGRVRLTANLLLPTSALTDDFNNAVSYPPVPGSGFYLREPSKAASLFYGVGVGIVAVSSANFVMAPGLAFSRTDVSDYGSSLAAAFPFEWVMPSGLRLGLEFDAGRALGGSYRQSCSSSTGLPGADCGSGPELVQDRPAGTSIVLQFQLGFGFNHPDPLPPEVNPAAKPSSVPPAPAPPSVAPTPAPG